MILSALTKFRRTFMERYNYKIDSNNRVIFNNNTTYCIGTGRMNLALRHEYHNQLKKVQEEINFTYIRGHGLFCDDMAIYQTYLEDDIEKVEYNFSYVDMVFDGRLGMSLRRQVLPIRSFLAVLGY